MSRFSPGMRARFVKCKDIPTEAQAYLPIDVIILGRPVDEDDLDPDTAGWMCSFDSEHPLSRYFGSFHAEGYRGTFAAYIYEYELETVGPPETVRQMSYHILAQLNS